jgi:hypothetical protein
MEKLQRDFLWGSGGEGHKFHLVRWDNVFSPLAAGGLGLRRLHLFNKALLGKWLWRFTTDTDSLWRNVILEKYGCAVGRWRTPVVNGEV